MVILQRDKDGDSVMRHPS